MLPDTGIDDVKKQRNAEYAKHIQDPVLSSLKMEGIRLLFVVFDVASFACGLSPPAHSVLTGLRLHVTGHAVSTSCLNACSTGIARYYFCLLQEQYLCSLLC
jgi:hypothetical protein